MPVLEMVSATEPVEEPTTLFAPNDAAFAAIEDVAAGLSPEALLQVGPPVPPCPTDPLEACCKCSAVGLICLVHGGSSVMRGRSGTPCRGPW